MGSESLGALQRAAADEVGLPSQFAGRIVGSTYEELRRDARKAMRDFGFPIVRFKSGRPD
jgi:hypothetical protein